MRKTERLKAFAKRHLSRSPSRDEPTGTGNAPSNSPESQQTLQLRPKTSDTPSSGPNIQILWEKALLQIKSSGDKDAVELITVFWEQISPKATTSPSNSMDMAGLVMSIKDTMERQMDSKSNQGSATQYVKKTISVLNQFISVGDVAVSYDPVHAALPWAVVRTVLVTITAKIQLDSQLLGGMASVTSLLLQCSMYQRLYMDSDRTVEGDKAATDVLDACMVDAYVNILHFLGFAYARQRTWTTTLTAPFNLAEADKKVKDLDESSRRLAKSADDCERFYTLKSQGSSSKHLKIIGSLRQLSNYHSVLLESVQRELFLSKLQIAKGAAFDDFSHQSEIRCHPGTRVEILEMIHNWARDPDSPSVFWLQGMAGTGKSTISRTVAKELESSNLGGTFFFKRGDGDRGTAQRFFTTITSQMARKQPSLSKAICDAIQENPDVGEKGLQPQFQELILRPFQRLDPDSTLAPGTIVLVIDALDECDPPQDARTIISLLAQNSSLSSIRLKVFLTSRPEYDIRSQFNSADNPREDLILHHVEEAVIKDDIRLFLEAEILGYRREYNQNAAKHLQLSAVWPGKERFERLVQIATPLFIAAATISRMLRNHRWMVTPEKKVTRLLEFQTKGDTQLAHLYRSAIAQVLSDVPTFEEDDVICRFQEIVGSIILLASPLSASSLSCLLEVEEEVIVSQLDQLHSVLDIQPGDAPIRLFHLSFRDFLVEKRSFEDNGLCRKLWIEEPVVHRRLANQCLHLLTRHLRNDICELQDPGISRKEIDQERIERSLPPAVAYACLYWVYHVEAIETKIQDEGPEHEFLRTKFLNWLEALALLDRLPDAVRFINTLRAKANGEKSTETLKFLHDARRFTLRFRTAIEETPLQIYNSALVFSPTNSIIRQTFHVDFPRCVKIPPQVESDWSACLHTLERRGEFVAFSSDGKLVCGFNDGPITIWDPETAVCLQRFDHGFNIHGFTLRHDGRIALFDFTSAQIWDIKHGNCLQSFNYPHLSSSPRATFLPSGKLMIVGVVGGEYILYDPEARKLENTQGNSHTISHGVCISRSGKWTANWNRKSIEIYEVGNNQSLRTLMSPGPSVNYMIFSEDENLLIVGYRNGKVILWHTETGDVKCEIDSGLGYVYCLATSRDSRRLAIGDEYGRIAIWNLETMVELRKLVGHGAVMRYLAFSGDGRLLASASADKTIKIWDLSIAHPPAPETYSRKASGFFFSFDSRILVSWGGNTVKIWDVKTRSCTQTIRVSKYIPCIAISDCPPLAAIGQGTTVEIWDLTNFARLQTIYPISDYLGAVAFSAHGQHLISSSYTRTASSYSRPSSTAQIWDTQTASHVHTFSSKDLAILSVAFSSDSQQVALVTGEGIYIEDFSSDTPIYCAFSWIKSIAFTSQGTHVLAISGRWEIRAFSTTTGNKIFNVRLDENLSQPVYFPLSPSFLNLCLPIDEDLPTGRLMDAIFRIYRISKDGIWLMKHSKRVMWLPPEYRPSSAVMSGSELAICCRSGQFITMILK